MMLKELGPEIEPQMIQTIAAVAREPDTTLTSHDVEIIANMAKELGTELLQVQLEAIADLVRFCEHAHHDCRYSGGQI